MRKAALLFGMAAFAATANANLIYQDWGKYREITINTGATGANVAGAVANFPVLVRLANTSAATGSDVLAQADSTGADIRFTNVTGDTAYHHEIDAWSSTGAAIWVLIPNVAGNGETKFRMYWGNDTASSTSNGHAVFDTANGFLSVWHMGGTSGTVPRANSVAGGAPAEPRGSEENIASGWPMINGVIGLADTLRGQDGTNAAGRRNNDHLRVAGGFNNFNGQLAFSAWVYAVIVANGEWQQYLSMGNHNTGNPAGNIIWFGKSGTLASGSNRQIAEVFNGPTNHYGGAANTITPNEWQHVVFTVNGTTQALYRNGVETPHSTGAGATSGQVIEDIVRDSVFIGRAGGWPDRNVRGNFDEVRIARAARNADWWKLEYETQKPDATAITLGESQDVPPVSIAAAANAARYAGFFSGEGTFALSPASIANTERLTLTVSDVWGRTVWSKTVHPARDGSRALSWNGTSLTGSNVAPGMYMVRATVVNGGKTSHHVQRMISVRPN